jgi:O-antigen/teichoic acid export membrane protein
VLLGTFSVGLLTLGGYLGIGIFVSTAVVGSYFFAYQVAVQLGLLLSVSFTSVLVPTFVRLKHERPRLNSALERSLRATMLVASGLSIALAAVFEPLEQLLWHGKWSSAVYPVQIIAILYPMNVALSVPYALQLSAGAFREWGLMLFVLSIAVVSAAIGGAAFFGTPAGIAACALGTLFVGCLLYVRVALKHAAFSLPRIMLAVLPSWTLALIAYVAGRSATELVTAAPARMCIGAAAYAATYLVLSRLLLARNLIDLIGFLPGRTRPLCNFVLRLRVT